MLIDACQEALRPCTDHEYEPSNTQGSNEVDPDDAAMDMDGDLVETTRSQEQPTLSSPGPATPGSSRSAATPPPAAASSSTHRYGTRTPGNRTPGPGAPAWKEIAGREAQEAAREAEGLRRRGKHEQSIAVVEEQLAAESVIGSPYAVKQAKAVATSLFAHAGSLANAAKVMGRVAQLPEMRLLAELVEKPEERLTGTNSTLTLALNLALALTSTIT